MALLTLVLFFSFSAAASAATAEDVANNSLIVGADVYELHSAEGYTRENILKSMGETGTSLYFKFGDLWFDLKAHTINSLKDLVEENAVDEEIFKSWVLRYWYVGAQRLSFADLSLQALNEASTKSSMAAALEKYRYMLGLDAEEYAFFKANQPTYIKGNVASFVLDVKTQSGAIPGGTFATLDEIKTAFSGGVAWELAKLNFTAAVNAAEDEAALTAAVNAMSSALQAMASAVGAGDDDPVSEVPSLTFGDVKDLFNLYANNKEQAALYLLSKKPYNHAYEVLTTIYLFSQREVRPTTGVLPGTADPISGDVEFTFGFESATGTLTEIEFDIYLGEYAGEGNRVYNKHLGINLPAGAAELAAEIDAFDLGFANSTRQELVAFFGEGDLERGELYMRFYEAIGFEAGQAKAEAVKSRVFFSEDTWTVKLNTAVLDVDKIEFLVAVRDDAGAQWGENNYSLPGTRAFLYDVNLPSVYGFSSEVITDPLIEGEDALAKVTLSAVTPRDFGYEKVRIFFEAVERAGDVTFKARDSQGALHTFTNEGAWGPENGFPLSVDYSATTDWTLNFAAPGDYTIEFSLKDLTTGAVLASKSATVTVKERSTYGFSYTVVDPIIAGWDASAAVTLATVKLGDVGYEAVRFYFEKTAGAGDVTFKATDSKGVLHTFTNEGAWGPEEGFPLPAGYDATTDWTLNFAAADEYTIVFSLKDLATDAVLASESVTVTASSFEQLLNGASAEILEFTEAEKLTHLGDAHFGFTTNYSNAQAAHPALLSDAFVTSDKDAVIRSYYVSDDGSWVAPPVEMTLTAGVGQYLKGEGNRDPLNVEKAKSYYRVEIVSVGGVSVDELTEEVTITLSLDDDVLVRNCKHTLASAAITLTLEPHVYNIVLNANPSAGGILSGGGSYTHGSAVTVVAQPAVGYDFVNWTEDGTVVSSELAYTFTVLNDRTLVANFVLKQYEITVGVNPLEGGEASGTGTYSHGDTVTVAAAAKPGYWFVNWTENGAVVSEEASYSFTATAGRNLLANFEAVDWWSLTEDGSGVVSDLAVHLRGNSEIDYFELYANGSLISERCPIDGSIRQPNAVFTNLGGLEVRFYLNETDVMPCAVATVLGSVDLEEDYNFGKLVLTLKPVGTWSVTEEIIEGVKTSEFSVSVSNLDDASQFAVYAGGHLVGTAAIDGGFVRSIPLVFQDPSLLEVKFLDAGGEEIATAECLETGELKITMP
jgi:hypothetical protein